MVNLQIVWRRFIRRGTRLGLAAVFIATVQATLIITNSSLPLVQSQAVAQQIEKLPNIDSWISINLGDATQLGNPKIDQLAKTNLKKFDEISPAHFITFRPISDEASGRYQFVGVDSISSEVQLETGVLPTKCDVQVCEVFVVNQQGLTNVPTNFKIVGSGKLNENSPIFKTVESDISLLITASAVSALNVESTKGFPGSENWAIKITESQIANLGLASFLETATEINNELNLENGLLKLESPSGQLEKTRSQISVLYNRIISLELVTCLIGSFGILLVAIANRKRNSEFVSSAKRLAPAKVSKIKIDFITASLVTGFGLILGHLAGYVIFSLLTQQVSTFKLDLTSFLVIASTSVLLLFSGLAEELKIQLISFIGALVIWLTYIRNSDLEFSITLIGLVAAIVTYLLIFQLFRFIKNKPVKNIILSNRNSVIALVSLTAFLVTSLLSALIYLNTLEQNAVENAIYKSPTNTRITMGGEAQPMQFNSFSDYQKLSGGGQVFGVTKVAASFQENIVTSFPTQIIGVDNSVWEFAPNISTQTNIDLKNASRLIPHDSAEIGLATTGGGNLSVLASGVNEFTSLSAWFINDRLESFQLELTQSESEFTAQLPENSTRLIGFQLTELPDYKSRREHAVNEGKNALPVPTGDLTISNLTLNNNPVADFNSLNINYSLINGPAYFSLTQSPNVIPAIVDPLTFSAAKDNQVQLKITPLSVITLRIVGVSNNLPTMQTRFALIDQTALLGYLAAKNPELVKISELWLTNNLTSTSDLSERLYGLTIYDQEVLITENFSPTNASWTVRGIQLLIASSLFMYLLLFWLVLKNIFTDNQVSGWVMSGSSKWPFLKRTNIYLNLFTFLSFIVALVISLVLTPIYIEKLAFDINGVIASPALAVASSWSTYALLVIGIVGATLALTFSYTRLQATRSQDST